MAIKGPVALETLGGQGVDSAPTIGGNVNRSQDMTRFGESDGHLSPEGRLAE
jgi:hypothetical protein